MSFWDTVKGHNLADTLIYCLPKLLKEEDVKQYSRLVYNAELIEYINEEIKIGGKVVAMTPFGCHSTCIVFERKCKR